MVSYQRQHYKDINNYTDNTSDNKGVFEMYNALANPDKFRFLPPRSVFHTVKVIFQGTEIPRAIQAVVTCISCMELLPTLKPHASYQHNIA